ncbi:amidohydrolase family protein [Bacteroides mediterraneensis]|uniref:Amidohydrolase n=1 Tax=Bacteroides mediterraneensis TaxID=1841856 RepID=A0ABS2EZ60_9BACE|nr:amidohydrolase family protein [Bacteroides mediterraneensis]MBM6759578.1 amidohydrolase [Bacteroides mediterraneensis]
MNKLILTGALCAAFATVSAQMVDVHSHIILPEYREVLKAHGAELEETFPLPEWNVERHIAFMDSAGIRTAVLTMPAPQPYYGDAGESAACIRRVNEVSAEMKQRYPERFKFCASLPLPDVEAAIWEAVYALDTLGADGVKLATNSRGQYLGDEALDPLMEILNERHAVVILHPHRPTPYPKEIIATTPLAMYEYPAETTRAVVNMLARNVLVRYPNLKVVVPHCGSFLPLALPRMKSILPAMVKQGYMQPIDWEGNLSRLYFDLAGNPTMEILRSLLTLTTPDHILYGSDYPYLPDAVLKANLQRLKQTLASDKELAGYADLFLWKNADGLFIRRAAAGSIRKE